MSDYIKELNIVDFLGIIVPGSILVLLLSGDNANLLLLWTSYFGEDASSFVRGIFLVIAGYLAGMILHEIGDLAEKGVWCFTRLDPKAYAINAVGIDNLDKATQEAKLNTNVAANQCCVLSPRIRGIMGCILAILILSSCTLGFSHAMRSAIKANTAYQTSVVIAQSTQTENFLSTNIATVPTNDTIPDDTQTSIPTQSSTEATTPNSPKVPPPNKTDWVSGSSYFISLTALTSLLTTIFFLGSKLYSKNDGKNANAKYNKDARVPQNDSDTPSGTATPTSSKPQNKWEMLERLCLQNPQIQTYVARKGALSKMAMFDSFRHVMRNLLIGIAIVNVFSFWHPIDLYRNVAAYFILGENISQDFGALTFWFCFVILFAFSRYVHFVFLRYKYSYEDFISKVPSKNEPDVVHHHILIEYGEHTPSDT